MIIDLESMERVVRKVEDVWLQEDVSFDERELVLNVLLKKVRDTQDKMRAGDLMSDINPTDFKGLLKRMVRGDKEETK